MKKLGNKLFYILEERDKYRLILLFIMMVIGGLMEMVGVSLVLPLIDLIINNPNPDIERVVYLAVLLIIVYIFKNVFLLLMYRAIFRFVYNGITKLSGKLMNAYLKTDYSFHLNKNVADIERAVCHDSESVYRMVKAMLQLIAEVLIGMILAAFLLYTDIWMSLFLIVIMLVVCGVFIMFSKKSSRRLGKEDIENAGQIARAVLQSFGGIKEVKLLGRENFFLEKLLKYRKKSSINNVKQQLLLQIPRLLVETVCIAAVMIIIVFEVLQGENMGSLIPKLGVFAVAAFRLLPSVGKINSLTTEVLFFKPAIDITYDELKKLKVALEDVNEQQDDAKEVIKWNDCIELKDLSYKYKDDLPNVLSHINLKIKPGSAIGLIGPSGSGKTTLADIIMGLLKPSDGKVLVGGNDVQQNIRSWQRQIGYVPQSIYLCDDSIRRNIAFGLDENEIDDDKVWAALKKAQLEEFVKNCPDQLDMNVGDRGVRLSGGQRQRIGIARALYYDPKLLIFDEATSALDTETEGAVMQAIESLYGKKTMIIIAHRLSTLEKCDIIYKVDKGNIEISRV